MKDEKVIIILNYVAWCLLALAIVVAVLTLGTDVVMAITVCIGGFITAIVLFALANILEALNVSANNSAVIAEELIKLNNSK